MPPTALEIQALIAEATAQEKSTHARLIGDEVMLAEALRELEQARTVIGRERMGRLVGASSSGATAPAERRRRVRLALPVFERLTPRMAADEPVDLRKDSIQLTPELRVSRTSTPYGMDIAFETSTAAWAGQILEVTDESCRPWMFVALAQDDRGASGAVEVATDAERVRVWVSESAFPVDELSASDADVVVRSAKASRRTTRNAWRAIARSHPETHFINEAVRKAFAD